MLLFGLLVYIINDMNKINFVYIDIGLKFFIWYGYIVWVVNNGGFLDSDVLIVIID